MTFAYQELTITGTLASIEGTAAAIQEIKNTLINDIGWSLTEDRSDQASTDHKVILQSNGETGTEPTFYFVLTSGLSNEIGLQLATYWDTSSHTAGSGTINPSAITSVTLETEPSADFTLWISGDKDSVTLLSKTSGSTYDGSHAGRIDSFFPITSDPFPLVIAGSSSASVDVIANGSTNIYSFAMDGTAYNTGEVDFFSFYTAPLSSALSPTNQFGATESYVLFPIIVSISDTTPERKSVRGFTSGLWTTIGPSATHSSQSVEDEFQSGDGRVYKTFFNSGTSSRALVIRKS